MTTERDERNNFLQLKLGMSRNGQLIVDSLLTQGIVDKLSAAVSKHDPVQYVDALHKVHAENLQDEATHCVNALLHI